MQRVYIIGVGDDGVEGLTAAARDQLAQAEVVLASSSILNRLGLTAKTIELSPNLEEVVKQLAEQANRRTVLLTTGDPLFYGVARYLCDRLGKERFEVVPHVSTMQLAFARVKESWDDAYLASLSTQPLER